MDLMNVLKNLGMIYWGALGHKKWPIAFQVLELQEKYRNLLKKQHLLPQCLLGVTREASIIKQQRRGMGVDVAKLGLTLKHPPPVGA